MSASSERKEIKLAPFVLPGVYVDWQCNRRWLNVVIAESFEHNAALEECCRANPDVKGVAFIAYVDVVGYE